MLPYISNDHISKVYDSKSPYSKGGSYLINKYRPKDKSLKGSNKLYDYANIYGSRQSSNEHNSDYAIKGMIPKRKLSPLNRRNLVMI